jgi:hypothetical protein
MSEPTACLTVEEQHLLDTKGATALKRAIHISFANVLARAAHKHNEDVERITLLEAEIKHLSTRTVGQISSELESANKALAATTRKLSRYVLVEERCSRDINALMNANQRLRAQLSSLKAKMLPLPTLVVRAAPDFDLDSKISVLGYKYFGVRCVNALRDDKTYATWRDAYYASDYDLLHIRSFGRKSLISFRSAFELRA